MTKFQKIQIFSSVIPYYSTFFVFTATMIILKQKKASFLIWLRYTVIITLSVAAVFLANNFLLTGQNTFLTVLLDGLILLLGNYLCVKLQSECNGRHVKERVKDQVPLIVVTGIFLAACLIYTFVQFLTMPSVVVEDQNEPEDTSLAVITAEHVLSVNDHYSAHKMWYSNHGSDSSAARIYRDVDYDTIDFQCEKISGIKTIHATKVHEDPLILDLDSTVISGNLELFLIVDGELYREIPGGQREQITLDHVCGKEVLIKIGAESANVNITVSR